MNEFLLVCKFLKVEGFDFPDKVDPLRLVKVRKLRVLNGADVLNINVNQDIFSLCEKITSGVEISVKFRIVPRAKEVAGIAVIGVEVKK